jgi:hypothetical protein
LVVPQLRVARDHDGRRDVRLGRVIGMIDELRQQAEVHRLVAQHVLVDGARVHHTRGVLGLDGGGVAASHVAEAHAEPQRDTADRSTHVGDHREA